MWFHSQQEVIISSVQFSSAWNSVASRFISLPVCTGCTRSRTGEVESLACYRWFERASRHVGRVETAAVGNGDRAWSWVPEVLDTTDSLGVGWTCRVSIQASQTTRTSLETTVTRYMPKAPNIHAKQWRRVGRPWNLDKCTKWAQGCSRCWKRHDYR